MVVVSCFLDYSDPHAASLMWLFQQQPQQIQRHHTCASPAHCTHQMTTLAQPSLPVVREKTRRSRRIWNGLYVSFVALLYRWHPRLQLHLHNQRMRAQAGHGHSCKSTPLPSVGLSLLCFNIILSRISYLLLPIFLVLF